MRPSLVVIGTGIKTISHITIEAKAEIEQSEKVLYLVNDYFTELWIKKLNPNSESLTNLYFQYNLRAVSYKAITNYIISYLEQNFHVCAVFYGHPIVFSQPGLDAILWAKSKGFSAKVLPGVSSEDCLFADLLIDPGSIGCQSWEATDFLIYDRTFDTSSALILWQVGVIGALDHNSCNTENGLKLLKEKLLNHYYNEHEVILYEAAKLPGLTATINRIQLSMLEQAKVNKITTLYIPPGKAPQLNSGMLEALDISNTKI